MEAFHDMERFYDQMDKFTANYSSLRNKLVTIICIKKQNGQSNKKQVCWMMN